MYCVYFTIYTGTKLPKRYIGSTKVDRISEGYNGTIKSRRYKDIYTDEQLNNKHLFKTRILSYHEDRKDALNEENRLHIKYDVVKSDDYMNLSYAQPDGQFGISMNGEEHPQYGKPVPEETKRKISNTLKERYAKGEITSPFAGKDNTGENNGFYGRKHSEETKAKMSKPKKHVPRKACPHCDKMYDYGNLKQHLRRQGWTDDKIEQYIKG